MLVYKTPSLFHDHHGTTMTHYTSAGVLKVGCGDPQGSLKGSMGSSTKCDDYNSFKISLTTLTLYRLFGIYCKLTTRHNFNNRNRVWGSLALNMFRWRSATIENFACVSVCLRAVLKKKHSQFFIK